MKLSKILAGVSLAAMVAGNASALDLTINDADLTPFASNVIVDAVSLADESIHLDPLLGTAGALDGLFELEITTTGTIAAGQNLLMTLDVTGGTFSTSLDGTRVTGGDTTTVTPPSTGINVSGASVQLDTADNTLTGELGESSVTYLVSVDNAPGSSGDHFGVVLPITYGGCAEDLEITLTLTTETGSTIEEGTVSLTEGSAVSCFNAYQSTISSDKASSDSVLTSLTGFEDFDATVVAANTDANADATLTTTGLDTTSAASLGAAVVEFNPDNAAGPLYLDRLDTPTAPLTGAPTEASSLEFVVNVADDTALVSAGLEELSVAQTFTSNVSALITAALPAIGTNNFVDNVELIVASGAQVTPQTPFVTAGVLNFSDIDLIANEPAVFGELDDLNYEGVSCGMFDWVGDEPSPIRQVFRMTGYGDFVTEAFATLYNARNAGFPDGTVVPLPYTAADFAGAEITINNRVIGAAAGDYGRADIQLTFVGAEQTLDCDRLQVSSGNAIVSPFGNGTAVLGTPLTDGDDN